MAETTEATPTKKKPAARNRSRNRPSGAARRTIPTPNAQRAAASAIPAANAQDDWRALNRIVSRFMAGHPNASIGETTIGELLAYAEQKRPKTMTAGGAA